MGMELIIQIIAGLVGGNAAGAGLKNLSLGTTGNSVAGAVGGGLGGLLMGMLGGDAGAAADAAAHLDIGAIIQSVETSVFGSSCGDGVMAGLTGITRI